MDLATYYPQKLNLWFCTYTLYKTKCHGNWKRDAAARRKYFLHDGMPHIPCVSCKLTQTSTYRGIVFAVVVLINGQRGLQT